MFPKAVTPAQCLALLLAASALPALALPANAHPLDHRALLPQTGNPTLTLDSTATAPTDSAPASTPPTTTAPAATPTTTPVVAPTTTAPTDTSTTLQPQQPSSTTDTKTSTTATQSTGKAAPPSNAPVSTGSPVLTSVLSTDADGQTVVVVVTTTPTLTAVPSSSSAADASVQPSDGTSKRATFISLGVAGGIAVCGLVAFLIWKFSRKRFDDDDYDDAIKWPEPNLRADTGGKGGFAAASELDASASGREGYAKSVATASSVDLLPGTYADPYAVPPLPHLNPAQAYGAPAPYTFHEETPASPYYDPYGGPVPRTLQDPAGEAFPMTQLDGRARSPGPQMAYGAGRVSPGPQAAYAGGRVSPGPQAAYGAGRVSPSPQAAYGGGRMSPGPEAAYGSR